MKEKLKGKQEKRYRRNRTEPQTATQNRLNSARSDNIVKMVFSHYGNFLRTDDSFSKEAQYE